MAINTKTKIQQGMNNWLHNTREEIHSALDDYIVETPFGFSLDASFIDAMIELGGEVKPKDAISHIQKTKSEQELDTAIETIRQAIKDTIGGSIKKTNSSSYTVTSFGADGKKLLKSFIETTPDELSSLVEAIKCYYRDVSVPKAINNFFIEGLYKDYKDFLQNDTSVSMLKL